MYNTFVVQEDVVDDAMVTGRMTADKKAAGNVVLENAGLNASQAVNALYDRLIETRSVDFLFDRNVSLVEWKSAAKLIDSVYVPIDSRFDDMTRKEIKQERLRARGLM